MFKSASNRATSYHHAVVIGCSVAGMVAARTLCNHFERVTIIERDKMPQTPQYRTGVSQAHHFHLLLKKGEDVLELLFPGFKQDMLDAGAVTMNVGRELELCVFGLWRRPPFESALNPILFSRPLLEVTVYKHLQRLEKITVIDSCRVEKLLVESGLVAGVQVRERGAEAQIIHADLVVDASGRSSQVPQWLTELGYTPPTQSIVTAHPAYASRTYERPTAFSESWRSLVMMPVAPKQTRGGVIGQIEGNRWLVTLIGMNQDAPPTDEDGFLEFAHSLPSPRIYNALRRAHPLSKPVGYRKTENILHHYDKLPHYLEGLVIFGDAVCSFNPVYGQGMTIAALSGQVLDNCLTKQRNQQNLLGFAAYFQKQLIKTIHPAWQMATGEDSRWPCAVEAQESDLVTKVIQMYVEQVVKALIYNPRVAETFSHVQHMLVPPTTLMRPDVIIRVLMTRLRYGNDYEDKNRSIS